MPQKYAYHGSIVPDIKAIRATSKLHGSDKNVVYLSGSIPYALLYIWDAAHNLKQGKHVTAWIKDGTVYYEEQFPDQLKTFYDGVGGYLYMIDAAHYCQSVPDRESMLYSETDAPVESAICIPNVYAELQKYIRSGEMKVIPFSEMPPQKANELYSHLAELMISNGIIDRPDSSEALFYKTYFPAAWEMSAAN